MIFSLQLGKFSLSLGAERSAAPALQRANAVSPIQAWLRGEVARNRVGLARLTDDRFHRRQL